MTHQSDDRPVRVDDPDVAPTARARFPVAVIGAGPVGLAAAAHLLDRGLEPLVLEAGAQVGANIARWRHVRLFSPWCMALDPVSVRLLDHAGWRGPDPDALPTGADLLEHYLEPLADLPALSSRIRLQTMVVAVARRDLDKVRSPSRAGATARDHGPPAAAMCAVNRALLAHHRLVAPVRRPPTGVAALGTAADWSVATCC